MKGYYVPFGYMGYNPNTEKYTLFATEEEYYAIFDNCII